MAGICKTSDDRWRIIKTGKVVDAYAPVLANGGSRKGSGIVVLRGQTDDCLLHPGDAFFQEFTEPGEHQVAIRIILEPSLPCALNYPEVEAYWPGTIELPETKVRIVVKKVDKKTEVSP